MLHQLHHQVLQLGHRPGQHVRAGDELEVRGVEASIRSSTGPAAVATGTDHQSPFP